MFAIAHPHLSHRVVGALVAVVACFSPIAKMAHAQQVQIPTLQVCNFTVAKGNAVVKIQSRADSQHQGAFRIRLEINCDPERGGVPGGSVAVTDISMSDSTLAPAFTSKTIEQVTSGGKHSPIAFLNGRCDWHGTPCRYWITLADNKKAGVRGTPDVVGFLVFDTKGKRIAYGIGPVADGDIAVQSAN